jgi:hypothetical protein
LLHVDQGTERLVQLMINDAVGIDVQLGEQGACQQSLACLSGLAVQLPGVGKECQRFGQHLSARAQVFLYVGKLLLGACPFGS